MIKHKVRQHTRRTTRGEITVREHTRGTGTSRKPPRGKPLRVISKDTLQYIVYKENDYVIKEPKPGFESYPSLDFEIAKKLKGIVPETQLIKRKSRWILRQKFVYGTKGTKSDVTIMGQKIRKRGIKPRGLLPQDIIIDRSGKRWVVDVGNFTS